jgi:alkylation response protein AidB-like acyl-CoA dehydrogenase
MEPTSPSGLFTRVSPLGEETMAYRAPVADIVFSLEHAAGFGRALGGGLYGDLGADVVEAVLEEAGRFATEIIAPLNQAGDRHGTPFEDGTVVMPPGWKEAYRTWSRAGWNALSAPAQWGGQDLPHAVNAACIEMWNSAAMAFGLGPLLTMAAVDALVAHGSPELNRAKARVGGMDGNDAAHGAAGGLRRRRAPHSGRARRGRQLPHHRAEDFHHLRRA